MLIDFSVRNFGSIKDEMTLSAETGERLSRLKATNTIIENDSSLLKSLVVIGPNGSGKSNLIDALKLMKNMVLNDPSKITSKLSFNPFLLEENSDKNDTSFRIRFNYGQQTFEYAFSYQADQITFEELKVVLKTTERIYFSRHYQVYDVLPEELSAVSKSTKRNSLLLYNAQKANDDNAISVIQWFQDDLIFVDDQVIPDELANLMNNNSVKNEFLRFLRFADFNIIDVRVRDEPMPSLTINGSNYSVKLIGLDNIEGLDHFTTQKLFTVHKKYDDQGNVIGEQELSLERESRGTQKVFLIALSIINAQLGGNGKTLLFDEFDDSLHFELSKALLQIFNSKQNRNQFILTTHELQLLNSDLRTDQIYLIEKDFKGRSTLRSVFDFKDSRNTTRYDVRYMQRYIEGRFGALPQIDVQEMLSALDASGQESSTED
ncbi:MAG: ATP-binding protein [Lactobacillus sp.]|jgi:AAA15 family ATPase/GTPase|nr:ATP-binding protein [Lactobacillus sp.]